MKYKSFTIALLLVLGGCDSQKTKVVKIEPQIVKKEKTGVTMAPIETPKAKVLETEKIREWKKIWKSEDPLTSLKKFHKQHGVFMSTSSPVGKDAYFNHEGPCGVAYKSLVKDSKKLIESVWEINPEGKVLNQWNMETLEPSGIDGNKLIFKVSFLADPNNYDIRVADPNHERHEFYMKVNTAGNLEIMPKSSSFKKFSYEPIECPKTEGIESVYKFCVKEKSSDRYFVLQEVCT